MKVASVTRMVVDELTVALALFCKLHGIPHSAAKKELDLTPRVHFEEAAVWADSNARVVALIRSDPEAVVAGSYTLSEGRGFFSRLFGLGKRKGASAFTDDELEVMAREIHATRDGADVDDERARRLADLRELVDESFETS